jgi:hypothetical protein
MSEAEEQEGKEIVCKLVDEIDPLVECKIGRRDFDTGVYEVKLIRGSEETILRVSREDLEDLPATREIKAEIDQRLRAAVKGIRRPLPAAFATRSKVAFRLSLERQAEYLFPQRAVYAYSFVIEDVQGASRQASGRVTISRFAAATLISDSRQELRVCVNRIRVALDEQKVRFGEDPKDLFADDAWIREILYPTKPTQLSEEEIRGFIEQELYWIGYRLHGMNEPVALDDLVDCEYLGVRSSDIKRNAELLAAQGLLLLEPRDDELVAVPTPDLISKVEDASRRGHTRRPKPGFIS